MTLHESSYNECDYGSFDIRCILFQAIALRFITKTYNYNNFSTMTRINIIQSLMR